MATRCQIDYTKGGCRLNQIACGACPRKTCCKPENECQEQINRYLAILEESRLKLRLLRDSFRKRTKTCLCCGDGQTHIGRGQFCKEKQKLQRKIAKTIKRIIALKRKCRGIVLIPNTDKCCPKKTCSPCACKRVKTFSNSHGACPNYVEPCVD